MRVIETKLYTFSELDDRAKDRARDWWRQHIFSDSCDWEFVFEDAANVADILGIDLRQTRKTLMNGSHRYDPTIFFSGFWSQGDGACFEGSYTYKKGASKAVREYAPQDTELHRIADTLQQVQSRYFYKLYANMKQRGHYNHSGCMAVEVAYNSDDNRDISEAEDDIATLMRDFADWIYKRLESEYNYQSSDEAADEMLENNAYEFDEDGNPS